MIFFSVKKMKTCKKSVSFHSFNIMYKSDFKHNTIIVQLKIFILVLSCGQIEVHNDMGGSEIIILYFDIIIVIVPHCPIKYPDVYFSCSYHHLCQFGLMTRPK